MIRSDLETRLGEALGRHRAIAIAVSGGVDSVTLATFAHRLGAGTVTVIHAVSPAVPPAATGRVRRRAATEGWHLIITGAGEFDDPRYRDNPVDRCYFCKTNLYQRIRGLTPHVIASGANLDDLGDYRPGLAAASEYRVVHPFIEAEMDKPAVRTLARRQGLDDVSDLPAQPCLASRIETGIAIHAPDLAFVDRVETALAGMAAPGSAVRCRITGAGVAVEIERLIGNVGAMAAAAEALCLESGRRFLGIRPYRRGSMFVGGG
jgi:pyridinium-3,5-biscarboxylic acid mononucleotide sulfurtransferase